MDESRKTYGPHRPIVGERTVKPQDGGKGVWVFIFHGSEAVIP